MSKFTAFVMIAALRIFIHPPDPQKGLAPFASPSTYSSLPAKVVSINGSIRNQKVILDWVVDDNETADKFEVEKSGDGKNFKMAALVFGTDKPETDHYQFYEKAGNKKMLYRIKLINKSQEAGYSDVLVIDPNI